MNIFLLDRDIRKCARYHADQHVVKMTLESAQMLCTVVNPAGGRSPRRPGPGYTRPLQKVISPSGLTGSEMRTLK